MLSMSVEHLRVLREKNPKKRIVWVDIGGGTGKLVDILLTGGVVFTYYP
jgi:betaine lipid synthase